ALLGTPLTEQRLQDAVAVHPDSVDLAPVDLELLEVRCGMRWSVEVSAPPVFPEEGAEPGLQAPIDHPRVAIDAQPLLAQKLLPRLQIRLDLVVPLGLGGRRVDGHVDDTPGMPPSSLVDRLPFERVLLASHEAPNPVGGLKSALGKLVIRNYLQTKTFEVVGFGAGQWLA